MSIAYGNKSVTPGQPTIYTVAGNIAWVIIQNESPYTLTCSIDGTGSTRTIAAQSIDKVPVPAQGFNGNIVLYPVVILSNASNAPSYEVLLDAYGTQEEPTGNYPVALSRTVQVGGSVNTNVASTSAIKNDGNAPATSIIEATPADAAASTWSADTSGNLLIKADNAGVLTTTVDIAGGAAPHVSLIGGAKGALHLGQLAQGDTFDSDANGNTYLKSVAASNPSVNMQPVSGTTSLAVGSTTTTVQNNLVVKGTTSLDNGAQATDGAGSWTYPAASSPTWTIGTTRVMQLGPNVSGTVNNAADGLSINKLYLWSGRFRGIQGGSATMGSGTVINHGLGIAPDIVLITPNLAQPGSATSGVGSVNTTSFTATVGAGSSGYWMTIKQA